MGTFLSNQFPPKSHWTIENVPDLTGKARKSVDKAHFRLHVLLEAMAESGMKLQGYRYIYYCIIKGAPAP